eukprot:TRINITY_DN1174_c0_g1::TRINITY_DN1174_c0_g1_i1::g.17201::m.17201 TRINITY_DN1174_c0_g1::TRINITY_DN1174_c0_g1_i1::g.17201  ORF type:complete len:217 (-),score=75.17,Reticulon/PF02453.12/2.6e-08 TRINITY_DN1174_c0_g1_i1:170-820(-)
MENPTTHQARLKVEETLRPFQQQIVLIRSGLTWNNPQTTGLVFAIYNLPFIFFTLSGLNVVSFVAFSLFAFNVVRAAIHFGKVDLCSHTSKLMGCTASDKEKEDSFREVVAHVVDVKTALTGAAQFLKDRAVANPTNTFALAESCVFWFFLGYFGSYVTPFKLYFLGLMALAYPGLKSKGYVDLAKTQAEQAFGDALKKMVNFKNEHMHKAAKKQE